MDEATSAHRHDRVSRGMSGRLARLAADQGVCLWVAAKMMEPFWVPAVSLLVG